MNSRYRRETPFRDRKEIVIFLHSRRLRRRQNRENTLEHGIVYANESPQFDKQEILSFFILTDCFSYLLITINSEEKEESFLNTCKEQFHGSLNFTHIHIPPPILQTRLRCFSFTDDRAQKERIIFRCRSALCVDVRIYLSVDGKILHHIEIGIFANIDEENPSILFYYTSIHSYICIQIEEKR